MTQTSTHSPTASPRQVGLLAGAFLAMAASSLSSATFEFMAVPMQIEFGLSADQVSSAVLIPTAASLLVVFLAGSLADHVGQRRMALAGAGAYCAGALLVAGCWNLSSLIAGQAVRGVGALVLSVIGLALVNTTFREDAQRARVFAAFGALAPAVFIVSPVIAAWVSTNVGWRWVPVMWLALGAVAGFMSWRTAPEFHSERVAAHRPEAVTPVLAGLALTGVAGAAALLSQSARLAVASGVAGLLCGVALVLVMRRASDPSLDLRVLRMPGALMVVAALLLSAMPNLFFYTNLLVQYRKQTALTSIALLMMIPQAAAVVGALLSGPVSRRLGAPRASMVMLLLAALASMSAFAVRADSPAWVPVLVLTLCAMPIAGSIGPLTKSVMDLAPSDGSGAAASLRNALWSVGGTVGGVLVAGTAFAAFQSFLAKNLASSSLTAEQAMAIAADVRAGAIVADLAETPLFSDPVARELLTGEGLLGAQAQAYWVVACISAVVYLAAAALLGAYVRRRGAGA